MRRLPVLANSSMALILRVQVGVYSVSTCQCSELGWDTPFRYLASAGTPVKYYYRY